MVFVSLSTNHYGFCWVVVLSFILTRCKFMDKRKGPQLKHGKKKLNIKWDAPSMNCFFAKKEERVEGSGKRNLRIVSQYIDFGVGGCNSGLKLVLNIGGMGIGPNSPNRFVAHLRKSYSRKIWATQWRQCA